jgi:iron complex transport system substrate-binding protein
MRRSRTGTFLLAALLAILSAPASAQEKPQRIVSLNLCTDQLLLDLVGRERIASVSFLAADPEFSAVAEKARGVPANRGLAEEIVALKPDLVLAHKYAGRQAVAMLLRLGVRVVEIDLPQDLAAVMAQIAVVAEAVQEQERGRAMIAAIEQRLAALPPAAEPRLTAAIYEPSGFAFGANSLADAILRAAGYDNLAARLGVGGYARLGMENLLANPPDILVVDDTAADRRSMAQEFLDHPALRQRFAGERRVAVPRRLWICGGPSVAEAAALLAQARVQRR